MKKAENSVYKLLINNKINFTENFICQGILCDFFIPSKRLAIIITEKEHDHGEAYFAEMKEIEHLISTGFFVSQISQWELLNDENKVKSILMRQLGL